MSCCDLSNLETALVPESKYLAGTYKKMENSEATLSSIWRSRDSMLVARLWESIGTVSSFLLYIKDIWLHACFGNGIDNI
jgi:hypothetical protein